GVGRARAGAEVVALGGGGRPHQRGPSPTRRSTAFPRPSSERALATDAGGHVARHLVEAQLLQLEALVVVLPEEVLEVLAEDGRAHALAVHAGGQEQQVRAHVLEGALPALAGLHRDEGPDGADELLRGGIGGAGGRAGRAAGFPERPD